MKHIKIAGLKDRLSEHLRAVEKGAEVDVTDRDRPIARIVPIACSLEGKCRQAAWGLQRRGWRVDGVG